MQAPLDRHGTDSNAAIKAAEEGEDGGTVRNALVQYSRWWKKAFSGREFLLTAASLPLHDFWKEFVSGLDELKVAMLPCLSKVPISAGSERNWSQYGDVLGGRRARLGPEKSQTLVLQGFGLGRIRQLSWGQQQRRSCRRRIGVIGFEGQAGRRWRRR